MTTPATDFGSDPLELEINRANTLAFINARSFIVDLVPRVKGKSNTGGVVWNDQTPRLGQLARLISMTYTQRPTITVDGVERIAAFTLLMQWDAQIARYDWFMVNGIRHEVLELVPYNGYEIRALVDSHG